MPFDLVTKLIALNACKKEDKKPVETVIIAGNNNLTTETKPNGNKNLTRIDGTTVPIKQTNDRAIKESQTRELDRAGDFEMKYITPKVVRKTEPEPKKEIIIEEDNKLDFVLTRTEEPKKQEISIKTMSVSKPNQPQKKEEITSDGLGRLNMSDFF